MVIAMDRESVMNAKKVSIAEAERSFTQLLREAERTQAAILVFRREQFAGVILLPDQYQRLERLQAYFEALRLSQQLAHLPASVAELVRKVRQELEGRT
jgi:hypothetical protein